MIHLSYDLAVRHDLSVDRLVAVNQFGSRNANVTSVEFPVERRAIREVSVELYEFDRLVAGEEATTQISLAGYVNEGIQTLLTFAMRFPREQLHRPIVALRSRCSGSFGHHCVPVLDKNGVLRNFDLKWLCSQFAPHYRFLVSRKKPLW